MKTDPTQFQFGSFINATLGARDFSCAVSGFGQVFVSAFGRKGIPAGCEKKPLVPRVGACKFCIEVDLHRTIKIWAKNERVTPLPSLNYKEVFAKGAHFPAPYLCCAPKFLLMHLGLMQIFKESTYMERNSKFLNTQIPLFLFPI